MDRPMKHVKDSFTSFTQVVLSPDLNGIYRLFGGKLMEWIDIVAGIVAMRHSGHQVTTASYDSLEFLAPALLNDLVVLEGHITWVGNTSMDVCVESYVEKPGTGARTLVNRAHSMLVALDDNGKPVQVPGLILETDQEIHEWKAAEFRREQRKAFREAEKNI